MTSSPTESPTQTGDAAAPLLHDNHYQPDAARLISTLSNAFLDFDAPTPLHDVRLHCIDDITLPANKSFLAVRSPFFHRLFCTVPTETDATTTSTTLPLRSRTLRDVLHFIYTDDSLLIRAALARFRDAPSPTSTSTLASDLADLVDVAVAADYLQLLRLQRLAAESVTVLFHTYPSLACAVLQAVVTHRDDALRHCDALTLWHLVLTDPQLYFGIRDVFADPSSSREGNDEEGSQITGDVNSFTTDEVRHSYIADYVHDLDTDEDEEKPTNSTRRPVLDLSADTLEYLLDVAPPKDPHTAQLVFQAVHAWAAAGTPLPRRRTSHGPFYAGRGARGAQLLAESVATYMTNGESSLPGDDELVDDVDDDDGLEDVAVAVDSTEAIPTSPKHGLDVAERTGRWRRAVQLATRLDITTFHPAFLLDFAENSLLLPPGALFGAYRTQLATALTTVTETARRECAMKERLEERQAERDELEEQLNLLREENAAIQIDVEALRTECDAARAREQAGREVAAELEAERDKAIREGKEMRARLARLDKRGGNSRRTSTFARDTM